MSQARNEIMQRLRAALNRQDAESTPPGRLLAHPRGPLPAFAQPPLDQFVAKVEAAAASCQLIGGLAVLPEALATYLDQRGITGQVVVAPIFEAELLQWPGRLPVEYRAAQEADRCALTMATAGIAETGSLVLLANAMTPGTLNFLPEFCVCVVRRSRIVTHMEDAWDVVRAEHDQFPRAVHFVTGPSRTADVEQTLQLGAHGPRQLHVVILAD